MAESTEQKTVEAIAAEVTRSNNEIATLLNEQKAEIKQFKVSSEETATKIREAETRWDQAKADLAGKVTELITRFDTMEKKGQRPSYTQGIDPDSPEAKSLGARFAEVVAGNLDEFKSGFRDRRVKGLPAAEGKTIWSPEAIGQKALVTTETTNFIPPYVVPGIVPMGRRDLRMRDLMPTLATTAPSIRYIREYGFSSATASAVTSITRSGQVATVTTTANHGWKTGDYVLIIGAAQTEYNGRFRITKTGATTFTYTVTGSPATPATGTITAVRLNNWGAAAGVSETSAKPEAKMRFEEVLNAVEVIAHWLKASKQVLDDLPGLRNMIDNRLIYGLRRKEEEYLLYGTGTTPQIQGILTLAGTLQYAWSNGPIGSGDTQLDAIRRGQTLVQIAEQSDPTAGIMHPLDWEAIELTKSDTGTYILQASPQPGTDPNTARVWRMPLIITPAIAQGTVVMGPWDRASALYDREQANVRFADQHSDDFTNNLVTILAEERIVPAWFRPEAFTVVTLDQAPAAS